MYVCVCMYQRYKKITKNNIFVTQIHTHIQTYVFNKMIGVHWSTVKYDPSNHNTQIWEQIHKDVANNIEINQTEIESMFANIQTNQNTNHNNENKPKSDIITLC